MERRDTIFALATAEGRAGVAVIRLSGDMAGVALGALTGAGPPAARRASLRRIVDPETGDLLDSALVLRFAQGASFTGEESVELHLHGSPAVVGAVLRALSAQPGCRMAAPGEFTRRALEHGRIDLAQVEGLADLIDAETDAQRRQALRVAEGELSLLTDRWRTRLLEAMARLEVAIDWVDEDVPDDVAEEARALVRSVAEEAARAVRGGRAARMIRDGLEVAVIGAPNVGKSTLINAICGRDIAIVSPVAGTTRDAIEARVRLGGLLVTFVDTAGLREAGDAVEREGVRRAERRAREADLRVFVTGPGEPETPEVAAGQPLRRDRDLIVWNKSDLAAPSHPCDAVISASTGGGVDDLVQLIDTRLAAEVGGSSLAVSERVSQGLSRCLDRLNAASTLLDRFEGGDGAELVCEELRAAVESLEAVIGRVGVEDVLDVVFSRFCLGK
jgi:tRNA modification GTPase